MVVCLVWCALVVWGMDSGGTGALLPQGAESEHPPHTKRLTQSTQSQRRAPFVRSFVRSIVRLARQKAEQEKLAAERRAREEPQAAPVVEAGADGSFDLSAVTAVAAAPSPNDDAGKHKKEEGEEDSERDARTFAWGGWKDGWMHTCVCR